tara:strand:- start:301 stop:606 length:306 start_codon:yes stop_codon:yes gene_type:complete
MKETKEKNMKEDRDKLWIDIQAKIQDDIEDGFEEISKIFDKPETDKIIAFYFLMFWSRVMSRYGKNGEKHDNTLIISILTSMMNGDLPPDMDNSFDRRVNN